MPQCSVILPVFNGALVTMQCLDRLLALPDVSGDVEIVVVDDGSSDATPRLLASYGAQIRVVTMPTNGGFARACNAGAAAAAGQFLVFLNNDTLPLAGWLEALLRYVDQHPAAAVVGSKLLFPDNTIQHAGVVICQDRYPRHIYAGFPHDHPAVNVSRRYQIVTGACLLIRRQCFEQLGGFDPAYTNGYEDVDLCLRLGEIGGDVHYCCESVVYHLESVSRQGLVNQFQANDALYRSRWRDRVTPDDVGYYVADDLVRFTYWEMYPLTISVSPLLAVVERSELTGDDRQPTTSEMERLLVQRSHHVFDLMKEVIRLRLERDTVLLDRRLDHGDSMSQTRGQVGQSDG